MKNVKKSIEIEQPVSTVYNQWTQFESFPEFMEGVEEVSQLDDKRLHWVALVGGKRKEWDAEISEQIPDRQITWRSTSGAPNAGTVAFERLDDLRTRVELRLSYEPEGMLENMGDSLGILEHRIEGDLERFRNFIEARRAETGAWRGEIHSGGVKSPAISLDQRARAPLASSMPQGATAPGRNLEPSPGSRTRV